MIDGEEADYGVVHLIERTPERSSALEDYLGPDRSGAHTGALDHVAFLAAAWPELRARCRSLSVPYVERTVPALGLRQVFLTDPPGVVVELNFPADEAS